MTGARTDAPPPGSSGGARTPEAPAGARNAGGHGATSGPVSAGGPATASPVRLTGRLDPTPSRWLWVVKWLLVLPHLVVLALLWPVVVVLTLVAGVAILVTGRYPRGLFDLVVGVMRWTWRVTFYAVVLGTDRYPPFALGPDPAYPADLEVAYPGELSRGLVLVKWWLLALPHYLVVGIFGGGLTWWAWGGRGGGGSALGFGLVGLLALIAGVTLAVTRAYPRPIFDFVMGMERWTFRVLAYAGLLTDAYPPFRLDTGGEEPPPSPTGPPAPPVPPAGTDLTAAEPAAP